VSDNQDTLALWSQYGDLYNEIVRPERKYTISHYMRTRWAPLLGAARLWFVTALRQRCFWNNKQDWCIVDKDTLARESGLSLRTVNRIIARADQADDESPSPDPDRDECTSWFFDKKRRRRYNQRIARTVNAPNRYHVLLDDPLTPDDQAALARLLRRELTGNDPEDTLRALQRLCNAPDPLLHENPTPVAMEGAQAPLLLAGAFTFDIVQALCPMPDRASALYASIARAASQLHNAITRPERVYMGNQYFRLQWLPNLGPTLALLLIDLRARCYWNERTGQVRDTCQATWAELAREIGCTTRQLRNLRQNEALDAFFEILDEGRGRAPSQFRVHMFDPLTPQDQKQFETRIKAKDELDVDPETGQIDMYRALQAEPAPENGVRNAEGMAPGTAKKGENLAPSATPDAEVLAPRDRKIWHVEGLNAEILASQPGKNGTTDKIRLITPTQKGLGETTISLPVAQQPESLASLLAAAVLDTILSQFDIVEPNRSRIVAQKPRCDVALAWCLYTLSQPGLSQNRAGYVYNRLRDHDLPPPDFVRMAGLSPPEWRECHRAMRYQTAERLPAELRSKIGPLIAVWDTLSIDFAQHGVPDGQLPEPVMDGVAHLPAVLADMLREPDRIVKLNGQWVLTTRNLYRGCKLARAAARVETALPIRVHVRGKSGIEYPINPEILALAVAPLPRGAWRSIIDELALVMTRSAFMQWWRDVLPLGLAEGRVLLGVPTTQTGEWIAARQLRAVERICAGVLGQHVQVEMVTYAFETPEPIPI
jgi:hypothetical protein